MATNGSNQTANKFILANCLNQTPSQVRSASASSSLSSISSSSTSPQMTTSQISNKSSELINSQYLAKNLPIQTSLYPTYTTSAYTYLNSNYLYAQPNRLIQNSANFASQLTNLNEKSTFFFLKNFVYLKFKNFFI